MIREIVESDFDNLLELYMQLHNNPFPDKNDKVMEVWDSILNDSNHHIIVADIDGKIVSSCFLCHYTKSHTKATSPCFYRKRDYR